MLQTDYTVVRPVRILGRNYQPGDVLDDPKIPVGVLAVLSNTRKIGVRVKHVAGGPDPEPVPGTAPAPAPPPEPVEAPEPVDSPEPADAPEAPQETPAAPEKGAAGDPLPEPPVPPVPEPPAPDPVPPSGPVPPPSSALEVWRGHWADRPAADGATFRRYMMEHLAEHRLSQHGSVHDLAQRLQRAKVKPRA